MEVLEHKPKARLCTRVLFLFTAVWYPPVELPLTGKSSKPQRAIDPRGWGGGEPRHPGVSVRGELGVCWAPTPSLAWPPSVALCGVPWKAVLLCSLWSPNMNQLLGLRLSLRQSEMTWTHATSVLFASRAPASPGMTLFL